MDHSYKVFLTSYEMQHEVAIRLAELFNRTGISHFDFDGHEGCWSSGQGDFGLEMFAKVFYDNVTHAVHNGTSNSQPIMHFVLADHRLRRNPHMAAPPGQVTIASSQNTVIFPISRVISHWAGYRPPAPAEAHRFASAFL